MEVTQPIRKLYHGVTLSMIPRHTSYMMNCDFCRIVLFTQQQSPVNERPRFRFCQLEEDGSSFLLKSPHKAGISL